MRPASSEASEYVEEARAVADAQGAAHRDGEPRPTAAELREAKEERVAKEQAELEAARERQAAENTASSTRGAPRINDQVGIFDKVIEDPDLEEALDKREKAKEARAAVNAEFKTWNDKAKGIINGLDLEIGQVARAGRFTFERTAVAAKQVSFETEPSEGLKIVALDK